MDMNNEDNTDMVFDCCQGWKVENEKIKSDLLRAIDIAKVKHKSEDENVSTSINMSVLQGVLSNHGIENMRDADFPRKTNIRFMLKTIFNT